MGITLNPGAGGTVVESTTDADSGHEVQKVGIYQKGSVPTPIYRYLDTNGDGTGTTNAVGNYSGAVTDFKISPGAGEIYRIMRLIVSYTDTNGFTAQEYGNAGATLTNGITIEVWGDPGPGQIYDLTDGLAITTNAEWARTCYDVDLKTWGAGDELMVVRWTFARAGYPIRLDGDNNDELRVRLNDNFTPLLTQYFMVQGYEEEA